MVTLLSLIARPRRLCESWRKRVHTNRNLSTPPTIIAPSAQHQRQAGETPHDTDTRSRSMFNNEEKTKYNSFPSVELASVRCVCVCVWVCGFLQRHLITNLASFFFFQFRCFSSISISVALVLLDFLLFIFCAVRH